MRHQPDDDLESHEADDEEKGDREITPIGVGTDCVRMSSGAMVMVAAMAVIGARVLVVVSRLHEDNVSCLTPPCRKGG